MRGSELNVGIVVLYDVRDEVLRSQRSRGHFAPAKDCHPNDRERAQTVPLDGKREKDLFEQYAARFLLHPRVLNRFRNQ